MLGSAAEKIKANRDYLSKLDAATGDGDHGTAMFKVATAIIKAIQEDQSKDIKVLLKAIGWAVMSTDAGSTSPLYGSLFVGMSEGVGDNGTLDCPGFVLMLKSGVAKLRKHSRAQVGDKTMIDALAPATEAIQAAVDNNKPLGQALEAGLEAAVKGADSTKDMKATFGRAKNIGERSIGHVDPGATSISYFFAGLSEGFNKQ